MFEFKKKMRFRKKTCKHVLTVPNFSYPTGQLL